jgi:hypothetical protein
MLVFSFLPSQQKGKRNKKLCDLCASDERSEWAVKIKSQLFNLGGCDQCLPK